MAKGHNPYRRGTASYARFQKAILNRRVALAEANAARAKKPEARRRLRQQVSAAKRALRAIERREDSRSKLNERREEFRSKLDDDHRRIFDSFPITRQDRLIQVNREYPDSVPKDIPDPFEGPQREALWRLSHATRAGIRMSAPISA